MARKPRSKSSARSHPPRRPAGAPKDTIVDALMMLLATRDFDKVGLDDIARQAGVSLADLRDLYSGKLAIVAAFSRRIDRAVLDGGPAEGETARDRLFEILMRRFDALGPHKAAVRSVARAARRDLCLGRSLHKNASGSLKWLMTAAGAGQSGALGGLALQGLVLVNADALRVWLDEEDPGLAKTMATLDRGLQRGERAMRFLDDVCSRVGSFTRRDRATRGDTAATA